MKLLLQRVTETPLSTQGHIAINGVHECFTLERPSPQYSADFHCIPAGTYKIELYASPHFGRLMPLLVDVPGHSNIEIHWGNFPSDSRGCILVGVEKAADMLYHTRDAFDVLFPMIEIAVNHEGCEIEVADPEPALQLGVDEATQI
jgi:hypothetical protein